MCKKKGKILSKTRKIACAFIASFDIFRFYLTLLTQIYARKTHAKRERT